MRDGERFRARLSERTNWTGIPLSPEDIERFFTYYELLVRWNSVVNLTALPLAGMPDETLDRLFTEPIVASRFIPGSPLSWLDVGSGGGSPAIPLKILRPRARLTMAESKERKAAFLREVVRELGLTDSDVHQTRVEQWASSARESLDVVTVRAVKLDLAVMEATKAHMKKGSCFLSFGSAASVGIEGLTLCEETLLGPGDSRGVGSLFVYERG